MNKIIILAVILMIGLFGCNSTNKPAKNNNTNVPFFIGDMIEIDSTELYKYWEYDAEKTIWLSRRPNWLPKGAGKASYFIIIDSNGVEIGKELINSHPDGWMTQQLLDKMPTYQYMPAETNPNKTSVKVRVLSEVKRMSTKIR